MVPDTLAPAVSTPVLWLVRHGESTWNALGLAQGHADQARLTQVPLGPGQTVPQLTPADYVQVPSLKAVGVFDTVSSLGVPNLAPVGGPIYDFNICDIASGV